MIYGIICWSIITFLNPNNSFGVQTALGLGVCSAYLSYFLFKKVHLLIGVAYLYYSIIAIRLIMFPMKYWAGFEISSVVGFESLVIEAHFYLTVITMCFALMREETYRQIKRGFIYLAVIDALVIWVRFMEGRLPFFLFNNPAIDVTFIACVLPLIYEHAKRRLTPHLTWILMFIVGAPCIFTKTSSGILGLGMGLSSYLWATNGFKRKHFMIGFYSAGLIAWFGWFLQGDELFNSSGRFGVWKMAMHYFWQSANIWLGTGAGTYQMYGPGLQIAQSIIDKSMADIPGFFWMHNSWLQTMFETGVLGVFFAALIFIVSLFGLKRYPSLFSSLVTWGALAVIQMPCNHFLLATLAAFLVTQSFRPPKEESRYQTSY